MNTILKLLTLPFLLGCADPETLTYSIGFQATAEEEATIHRAFSTWATATEATIYESASADINIKKSDISTWGLATLRVSYQLTTRRLALCEGRIDINQDLPIDKLYSVMLHEIGHALHLRHTHNTVMQKSYLSIELDPTTIEKVKENLRGGWLSKLSQC